MSGALEFFRRTQLFWVSLGSFGVVVGGIALSFNDTISLAGIAGALAAVAIFTFMGVYAYAPPGSATVSEEGRVRRAVAAAFVLFYLTLVPMTLMSPVVQQRVEGVQQFTQAVADFTEAVAEAPDDADIAEAGQAIESSSEAIEQATQGVANRILTHFTTLVGVVVTFYFGATTLVDRARIQNSRQSSPA